MVIVQPDYVLLTNLMLLWQQQPPLPAIHTVTESKVKWAHASLWRPHMNYMLDAEYDGAEYCERSRTLECIIHHNSPEQAADCNKLVVIAEALTK